MQSLGSGYPAFKIVFSPRISVLWNSFKQWASTNCHFSDRFKNQFKIVADVVVNCKLGNTFLMGYLPVQSCPVTSASLSVLRGSGGDAWDVDSSSPVEQKRKINDFCLLRSSGADFIKLEAWLCEGFLTVFWCPHRTFLSLFLLPCYRWGMEQTGSVKKLA